MAIWDLGTEGKELRYTAIAEKQRVYLDRHANGDLYVFIVNMNRSVDEMLGLLEANGDKQSILDFFGMGSSERPL